MAKGKKYIQHGNTWYVYCDACGRWKRIQPQLNAIEKPVDAGLQWFERSVYNLVCKILK